jgi:acyl-coenzyme A synthetase/AMP-(fatty) acid ligase
MSPYKVPKQLRVLNAFPRNAMGKVMKAELKGHP